MTLSTRSLRFSMRRLSRYYLRADPIINGESNAIAQPSEDAIRQPENHTCTLGTCPRGCLGFAARKREASGTHSDWSP